MIKTLACTLILTMTFVCSFESYSWALLAPAQVSGATQRTAEMKTIQSTLESKVLRQRLSELGLSSKEVDARLAQLSDAEVHQLATQLDGVNQGGLVVEILVVAVLVLLIVYLAQRIH